MSTVALTSSTMRIFFVENFVENIFTLMYFSRKTSSSRGKSRNRKLLLKIACFHAPLQEFPLVGVMHFQSTFRGVGGEYCEHLSVIKPLIEIFSFSLGIFHVICLGYTGKEISGGLSSLNFLNGPRASSPRCSTPTPL